MQNVNSHIRFFIFVILVSNVVTLPPIALKVMHWAKYGPNLLVGLMGVMHLISQIQLGMAFASMQ